MAACFLRAHLRFPPIDRENIQFQRSHNPEEDEKPTRRLKSYTILGVKEEHASIDLSALWSKDEDEKTRDG
ncbi:MAG: hypothetical protein DWC05_05105 [Candidatus Poseidoniales archaeon]|nr:MAG: hypothetical protein DWC05_05105 [Candidatus Poseidoniales archaeon]